MKQALIKKGQVFCEEVPAPIVSKGNLLIKTVYSCISAGTELSSVNTSGMSILKRAVSEPENVRLVLKGIKEKGITKIFNKVKGELGGGKALGYSLSGIVYEVGKDVEGYEVGDHVTASGAGLASHAEYVDVPVNLTTKISNKLGMKEASTVTLGAIAMQGVRRADLKLGEYCVVVGTGILGLLTVQILKTSGIRVAAVDLNDSRLKIAEKYNVEMVCNPSNCNCVKEVNNWTAGYGADAVIFTAATSASDPLSMSFNMVRKKGKVVLVGVSGMNIKREDIYKKELDFQISTSYGPGRYDSNYEHKGNDYPYAYVRWTENRNMVEYLRLLEQKKIDIEYLIESIVPIERVTEAYNSLSDVEKKPLMVLLDYGFPANNEKLKLTTKIHTNDVVKKKDIINVAIIGAGSFALNTHLPNFEMMHSKFKIHAVLDRKGANAKKIANQYSAAYATTDYGDILNDKDVDLVVVTTRHDSHASFAIKALENGKHVFVEKPLSISNAELSRFQEFYAQDESYFPVLFVGFNRRFSKYAREIKKHVVQRINPLFIRYRMNAGYIPADSWVHEYGGRIVGEACHIIDLMTFFVETKIKSISTESISPNNDKYKSSDNRSMIIKYVDGSICVIDYFAVGSEQFSKEFMELHFDGKTIEMNDYKSLKGYGIDLDNLSSAKSEKGQLEELSYLYDSITGKCNKWPIELWELVQTTNASLAINGHN
jgi:predicted dehydrogenase/threonine dehydrogenase-like Zn-dependent dehydrogenase